MVLPPLTLLRCPGCRGALKGGVLDADGHGLWRCARCGPYPVLAWVPVLVPSPAQWCAGFRESALAALAEVGSAQRSAVAILEGFAAGAPQAEPLRFGDDWTAHEAEGAKAPEVRSPAVRELLERSDATARWLAAGVPKGAGAVLELGPGSGALTPRLERRGSRVVVTADLSLRAVLRGRGERMGVVCDAEALPVRAGAFDAIVAEHLVDLLEEPLRFLRACARALKRHGTFLAATVEPSLGGSSDDTFARLVHQAGLRVTHTRDGTLWPRVHSPRRVELYVDFLLKADKR